MHKTNIRVSFKLFDSRILPILCYGSELWGFKYRKDIERVQIDYCKFILGVGKSTHSAAVLGECGRQPLYIIIKGL